MPQKIDSFLREGIGELVLRVKSMVTASVAIHAGSISLNTKLSTKHYHITSSLSPIIISSMHIASVGIKATYLSYILAGGIMRTNNMRSIMPADRMINKKVINPQGEDLGKIKEIMIDMRYGRVAYAVLTFSGLFGIAEKLFEIGRAHV